MSLGRSYPTKSLPSQRAQADPPSWRGRVCTRVADVDAMYDGFDAVGLQYGPAYRLLRRAWVGGQGRGDRSWPRAVARLARSRDSDDVIVHPAELDGALQLPL